jgi:hypothetical protein
LYRAVAAGGTFNPNKKFDRFKTRRSKNIVYFFFGAKIQNIITQMSSLCVLCKIYASKEDAVFVFGVKFRVELLSLYPFLLDSISILIIKN